MIAEPAGLGEADLDALFAEAVAAETAGKIEDALASLTIAIAELCAQGQTYQYPFEWLARLQGELGDFASAERSLLVARKIAEQADHRPGLFRMDVARARIACAAHDLAAAEQLLSGLRGDADPLGPPSTERIGALVAWLEALRFRERPAHNVAVLQVEAAMAIAELWAERGKYRSALALVGALDAALPEAQLAIRSDQLELLCIEWMLAAGAIADADARLSAIEVEGRIAASRLAVVRARTALTGGRLARAVAQLDALDAAPVTEPKLFALAMALRIAIQAELNLFGAAEDTAATALARLGASGGRALIDLLDNARRNATARRHSAIALWELPVLSPASDRAAVASARVGVGDLGTSSRFTAAWTTAANQVLVALERGDLEAAAAHHAELVRITSSAESSYIAARVKLSAAIVAFYRGPGAGTPGGEPAPLVQALLAVAEELRAIGARHDEAQAIRFAAWAAARSGNGDRHVALARRASSILDDIAGELDGAARMAYLMNKWSGRDELVAGRMRELLADRDGRPRRATRREIVRVFRDIDALTHWPVDHALGDGDARRLAGDATSDLVAHWLAERLSTPARSTAGRGFALRSALRLWWFPSKTLVLHYHVLPDRTYLFRIARRHIDVAILPVGRVHLPSDMRGAVDDREQLAWLAAHLGVADALDRFHGIRRLVIVPHDAVANAPFAILPVRGGVLCERIATAQIDRLSRLRRRARRRPVGRFVTVGLSSYAGSREPDLPEAENEVRAVAAALAAGAPQAFTGGAATCEGVRAALPGATHLHIAAHGFFDPMRPADSGVLLRDGAGHRALTLHALRAIDLGRMQLATLATCRSAASAQLPGRERICLPTALLDAGARGVIASLWPVDDQASVDVMTGLYRRLRAEPPVMALAGLQAELHRAGRPGHTWAGLVFYGND